MIMTYFYGRNKDALLIRQQHLKTPIRAHLVDGSRPRGNYLISFSVLCYGWSLYCGFEDGERPTVYDYKVKNHQLCIVGLQTLRSSGVWSCEQPREASQLLCDNDYELVFTRRWRWPILPVSGSVDKHEICLGNSSGLCTVMRERESNVERYKIVRTVI